MTSIAHLIRRRRSRKQRLRAERQRQTRWSLLLLVTLGAVLLVPTTLVTGVTMLLYFQAASTLPTPAQTLYLDPAIGATVLLDREERVALYEVEDPLGASREWVALDELPPVLLDATLLMEDPGYFERPASHPLQTLDRLWRYILGQPVTRDPSLNGRLVRATLLPLARESGLDDTLLEIALVSELRRQSTPEQVLAWYLNTAYYGNDAYGIEAAARVYLGQRAAELSLDEIALLAAIPPAPQFNPFDDDVAARGRQADLLRQLLNAGHITPEAFESAAARRTPLSGELLRQPTYAPDFALYARQQAEDILDALGLDGPRLVSRGGLRITTTLDLELYAQADCVLRAHLNALKGLNERPETVTGGVCTAADRLTSPINPDRTAPPDEGALFLLDVASGEIRAMVGPAARTAYQPGPTLKPFVYFQGFLSAEYTPASMVLDIPQNFPGPAEGLIYSPDNPDGRYRGPINLRDAMASGLLPPAVQVADTQSMGRVLVSAHRLGVNSLTDGVYDLSLLERGGKVSLLDMSYAYSVFAAQGLRRGVDVVPRGRGFRARDPVAILRIEDAEGNTLWAYDEERRALSQTNVFVPSLGYLVNDILSDHATRRAVLDLNAADDPLRVTRPAAVVQGTTSDQRDAWTLGYTPQIVLGVHLGRADRRGMSLTPTGRDATAPVWQALLSYAHERYDYPPEEWPRPDDVAEYVVCERSGLTPGASGCPTRNEVFLRDVPPLTADTYWETVTINSQTGQRATANTPSNLREQRVYFIPPASAQDWWVSNGQPLPPTQSDVLSRPELLQTVQILEPADLSYVGGTVEVYGTLEADGLASYALSYGLGVDPDQWFAIGGEQTTFTPGQPLATWNTSGLDAVVTLRLTAIFEDGSVDYDFKNVSVDNAPPTISLEALDLGGVVRWPQVTEIPIRAEVADNLALDRVVFYHNGVRLGEDDAWPYGFEHAIQGVGVETFRAVAYDQVGNQAEATLEIEVIR